MAVVLIVLVVLAFFPCLQNDFVSWDDEKNFLSNPSYRGLGWAQIAWDWTSFQIGVYQPLAWMLLGAQYLLFGLNPSGYHLASLVLYALNTVVLFVLTLALLIRVRPDWPKEAPLALVLAAGFVVALFAVHPLRTEVVAWASCQPYLPCALFAMLAVLAYLRAFPEGSPPRLNWLVAAFALFAAALCSKAVAVSLPVVLLILDVYPLRRLGGGPGRWFAHEVRAVWWEKVPFALLSVLFMGLAVSGRAQEHHLVAVPKWGIAARIAQACYGIGFYALKTIVPWNITPYYPVPERVVWYELPFVACIAGTLALSVALFLLRRRWPGLLAVWLSYLVILAPNLGLVRIGEQIAADRYSYTAMLGAVALVAAAIGRILQGARRTRWLAAVGGVAATALVLVLVPLARAQCRIWRTSETLWAHAASHGASTRSFLVHDGLGSALLQEGRLEEARKEFAEALRLNPNHTSAHNNLGLLLLRQGALEDAWKEFSEVLRLNPNHADAHNNLGLILLRQGRTEEARQEFSEAVRLNPDFGEAHNNLGVVLQSQGQLDGARAAFAETVRINPGNADAHNNLGGTLGRLGRTEEARTAFEAALRIKPDLADAHYNLGVILIQQGRLDEAGAEFTQTLRLKPDHAAAHNAQGELLLHRGRLDEAQGEFTAALRINPAWVQARKNLELLLRAQSSGANSGATRARQ
jgi:Tfp pilus assembly protein PilF